MEKVAVPDDANGKLGETNRLTVGPTQRPEDFVETGKPRLGEITRIKVNIVESYEFKVSLHVPPQAIWLINFAFTALDRSAA